MFNKLFRLKPQLARQRFLVMDLELSGLDAREHDIVSVGSVTIESGSVQLHQAQYRCFTPAALMGSDLINSAHIHGVTDSERMKRGEPLANWLTTLADRSVADAWVFHFAKIDLSFIRAFSKRYAIHLPFPPIYDTLTIERGKHREHLLDSQAQLSLNACRRRYGLPAYRSHHALSDALATAELFLAQHSESASAR